ncbi:unnamed protein product [Ilex paraguariensis]|uniref:Uncharacterized protein n=1 Tax=Ilex paraguariensis TaxID=185542 RepID=A0ABC8TI84_9AQUA
MQCLSALVDENKTEHLLRNKAQTQLINPRSSNATESFKKSPLNPIGVETGRMEAAIESDENGIKAPDSVGGKYRGHHISTELEEGTKERRYMTHTGWNSTLESIFEGVPMICWPYFADQQVNSRFVGEVWNLGVDMNDTCDRVIVEKMINDLMEVRRDEFKRSADEKAKLAKRAVSEGGSSYYNLDCLIEDIRLMNGGGVTHS